MTAHIELFAIVVHAYDPAIRFFVDVLGFDLVEDSPSLTNDGRPKRWVVVRPPGAASGILLAQADGESQAAVVGRQVAGRVGFFLRVDDFEATYSRMVAAGVEFTKGPLDEPYGRYAVFVDVAGNKWDLLGPASLTVRDWSEADRDEVIEHIVGIQREELGVAITAADQPDLADVRGAYVEGGGRFWVARRDGRVVGTIAAIVVEANTVAIRKTFVAASERGTGLAARLMDTLVDWARAAGFRTLLLGTTAVMQAAHRFYEKQGFASIDAGALPPSFPRMAVDTLFFRRDLPGVVALRPYDPEWPSVFAAERGRLAAALGPVATAIEHVGSTSVPGLSAKPIVDIALTVVDARDEAAYVPALESIGYTLTVREPEWFEHRLFNRDWPRVNLHVFTTGCSEVDQMTGFRDWLGSHPDDRQRYEDVKQALAGRRWEIVQDYADAKTAVVTEIKQRAGLSAQPG